MQVSAAKQNKGFEHYVREEDLAFRARARCNKLAGLWAADLQGLSGPDAEAFALEVVGVGAASAGEDIVIGKLHETLEAMAVDREDIRRKIDELKDTAWTEIYHGLDAVPC